MAAFPIASHYGACASPGCGVGVSAFGTAPASVEPGADGGAAVGGGGRGGGGGCAWVCCCTRRRCSASRSNSRRSRSFSAAFVRSSARARLSAVAPAGQPTPIPMTTLPNMTVSASSLLVLSANAASPTKAMVESTPTPHPATVAEVQPCSVKVGVRAMAQASMSGFEIPVRHDID
jgi:hypothetical protein